jgi:allantoinase
MSTVDLVVRANRAIIKGREHAASVAISAGTIVGIGALDDLWDAAAEVRLASDEVLMPGVVDTHVHVNEPGRTPWEGFATATKAAAAGGVTTIIDMPLNSIPPTTSRQALELKRAAAAPQVTVDVGFWGGAIPESLGHLAELHDHGVFGFKCFLAPSGVDEFPHLNRAQLLSALTEVAGFGGRLIVHAEDPLVLEASANAGGVDYADFVASRPDSAETDAIAAVIDGVRATGARAHILHLSSAAALPQIRRAKADGLPITVETCPHYLTFDAAHIPDGATQYKCCPPIRSQVNREELWGALADGTIDFVASDHSPATADVKYAGSGDFGVAWGGIAGLQVSLSAVWTGAKARGYSLGDVAGWMSGKTARWAGLTTKGGIRVGNDADLVAFAPDAAFTVSAASLEHKNPVSAFDGHQLVGLARTTWLRGAVVHGEGASVVPLGQLIARQ